jgi:Ca2+-binding EF-hand superfamily protein
MPRFVVFICAVAFLASATAQDQVKQKKVSGSKSLSSIGQPVEEDVQDFVFMDAARPLFIRLHVQIDGVGFRKAWEKFLERYFEHADGDRDGSLNSQEFQAAARLNVAPMSWANFDAAPRDGRVSKAEFRSRLAGASDAQFAAGANPAQQQFRVVARGYGPNNSPNAGSELSTLLDANRDGALVREELASAAATLRKLDLDDDELITSAELRPYDNSAAYGLFLSPSAPSQPSGAPNIAPISKQGRAAALARQLLDRYDQSSKDTKLSRQEIGWDAADFDKGDANSDGHLDLDELTKIVEDPRPQLALVVRLGQDAAKLGRFSLVREGKQAADDIRDNGDGTLNVDLGRLQLQFSAASAWAGATDKKFYERQLKQFDQDNNKYLDKDEARRSPFGGQFAQLDRDANGMLYLEEIVAFYEQQAEVSRARVTLSGTEQGKLLFDVVDANRDGRLSPRELAEAPSKLPRWDRNRDGKLVADEIPHQYAISIGRGGGGAQFASPVPVATAAFVKSPSPTPAAAAGPAWFQKMDRNRDGDLSPREFLGTAEQFKRLDADDDGLIDPREAAQAK